MSIEQKITSSMKGNESKMMSKLDMGTLMRNERMENDWGEKSEEKIGMK